MRKNENSRIRKKVMINLIVLPKKQSLKIKISIIM